jgi:hypothetical protein
MALSIEEGIKSRVLNESEKQDFLKLLKHR